jgi:hypothetical protein
MFILFCLTVLYLHFDLFHLFLFLNGLIVKPFEDILTTLMVNSAMLFDLMMLNKRMKGALR